MERGNQPSSPASGVIKQASKESPCKSPSMSLRLEFDSFCQLLKLDQEISSVAWHAVQVIHQEQPLFARKEYLPCAVFIACHWQQQIEKRDTKRNNIPNQTTILEAANIRQTALMLRNPPHTITEDVFLLIFQVVEFAEPLFMVATHKFQCAQQSSSFMWDIYSGHFRYNTAYNFLDFTRDHLMDHKSPKPQHSIVPFINILKDVCLPPPVSSNWLKGYQWFSTR